MLSSHQAITRGSAAIFLFAAATLLLSSDCGVNPAHSTSKRGSAPFTFTVTADMREFAGPDYDTSEYFRGVCEAIAAAGKGEFMISPGDIDPPKYVYKTITEVLGQDYPWYPVVGNHETETPADMAWVREFNPGGEKLPNINRRGPKNGEETTYSFDFANAHFVGLNQYYDWSSDTGSDGDVTDALYDWLKSDLEANVKPYVFVFGHEPVIPAPDIDNGRVRHSEDSLNKHEDNNSRFLRLLAANKVNAYICGHTHNTSVLNINGVWQLDAGHSRGKGDIGAKSTFLRVRVPAAGPPVVEVWRDDGNGGSYRLHSTWELTDCSLPAKPGKAAAQPPSK